MSTEFGPTKTHHRIEIAGLTRDLRLFNVTPDTRIAILNILGDTKLVQACAQRLGDQLRHLNFNVLVTPEAKSIPLAHELSVLLERPYAVLRKTYKPYMGDALSAKTLSITTQKPQVLWLDEKDRQLLHDKDVIILDDVISTGSTLQGMRKIIDLAGAHVVKAAAIMTEGDLSDWTDIISLGHLPVFKS